MVPKPKSFGKKVFVANFFFHPHILFFLVFCEYLLFNVILYVLVFNKWVKNKADSFFAFNPNIYLRFF